MIPPLPWAPDFQYLLRVLARQPTDRPVLFEFMLDQVHLRRVLGGDYLAPESPLARIRNQVEAYRRCGFDYAVLAPWDAGFLCFPKGERDAEKSYSQAHGGVITDRASLARYTWPDPEADDWSLAERVRPHLPEGMRLLLFSFGGVLENLVELVGYEELCLLLEDDPELVQEIADAIGSRLLRYYERGMGHAAIGGAIVNDDWGFKTQPFLSPEQMRRYITPWHRRIVQAIHDAGKPAILHSCGELRLLWEDLIEDLRFDGKHSYEDAILPVEQACQRYGRRIAILGGLDIDFLCRSTPEEVYARSRRLLEQTRADGGYALGSGNSITAYVPWESFLAMRRAAGEGYGGSSRQA